MALYINGAEVYAGQFRISNDGTKTTIMGRTGDYTRFGDAGTTGHALASEDDVVVTGQLEVDGMIWADNGITLNANYAIQGTVADGYYWDCRARDVDGGAHIPMIRFTSANDPTMAICASGGFIGFFGATAVGQQTGADELSTTYAEADIDTDAELVAVINVITTEVNALRTALNTYGLTTTV